MDMTWAMVPVLVAFGAGSIPFGFIIGKARGIDVREHGSKNIGATNVGRVCGRPWGFLCFGLDLLKGLLPTLWAGSVLGLLGRGPGAGGAPGAAVAEWWWMGAMAASVLGHMFSPWVGFKGGKGVATGLGALLGVWPMFTLPAVLAAVVWVVCLRVSRYVGLSSCLAASTLPLSVMAVPAVMRALGSSGGAGPEAVFPWAHFLTASALAGLVVFKHRGNLARTWAGTEFKVGVARRG